MSLSDLPDLRGLSDDDLRALADTLPESVLRTLADEFGRSEVSQPRNPVEQALELDEAYRARDHLTYLSSRFAQAVEDVEAGQSRRLVVSMPPRSGKSLLSSVYLPIWLLRKHPDWKIGLISHSPTLAVSWGRTVRRTIEEFGSVLNLELAKDAGAAREWQTMQRGGIVSRSAPGQSITGLGFKVMLLDDVVKDFAAAHSEVQRQAVWDWWLANSVTRLEPPSLVVVIGTRWHEDDFIGRLLSHEYEGDPDQWEVIDFPAIAETSDVLGRKPGEPLLSPLLEETTEEALERWEDVRQSVGTYTWAALYQQRPAPAKGAVFDSGWWRFWSWDPDKATDDGRVIHLDPSTLAAGGKWLDSWDLSFDSGEKSDWVVGQRWCRLGPNRYLLASKRGRWNFTETIREMKAWAGVEPDDWNEDELGPFDPYDLSRNPWGQYVHLRLVEKKANGAAAINVLSETISGLKPVSPTASKEIRARAVTPEIESGHVYLPHPSDPGNEWVTELLSELRNFPHDTHDDQVDTLTQALSHLRDPGKGSVHSPVKRSAPQRRPGLGQPPLGGRLRTTGFRR